MKKELLDKLDEYLLENFRESIIKSLDPLVKPTIAIMCRFPGITTYSSCQGHADNGYWGNIYFDYGDGTEIPPWISDFMLELEQAVGKHTCLGCLRTNVKLEYYFDCGHDLKQAWTLNTVPIRKYPNEKDEYFEDLLPAMWDGIAEALHNVYKKYYDS